MFDEISQNAVTPTENLSKSERMIQSSNTRKKTEKKKNRRSVLITLLIVFIMIVVFGSLGLKSQKMTVKNNDGQYSDAEILAAAGENDFRIILFPGADSIIRNLETKLPYLDGVTIETVMTEREIDIIASYTKATLAVETDDGGYIIMNDNSKVLAEKTTEVPDGVAVVKGVTLKDYTPGKLAEYPDADIGKGLEELVQSMKRAGVEGVTEYDLTSTRDVHIYLSDGGEIRIGALDSMSETKLSYISAVYKLHKEEATPNLYIIEVKNTTNAYTRVLDETLADPGEGLELVTDEYGEPVTDEDGAYIYEISEIPTDEAVTEDEPTAEITEEPSSEEAPTQNPLAGLHSSTTAPSTAADTTPAQTEMTDTTAYTNPLAGLHASTEAEADSSEAASNPLAGLH